MLKSTSSRIFSRPHCLKWPQPHCLKLTSSCRARRAILHASGVMLLLMGILGCGRAPDPVRDLSRDLDRFPEYSLVIDDLNVEDGFFPDYFMRFRLMTASGQRVAGVDTLIYETRTTEWQEVSEEVFARYQHYLGMVVAAKGGDGKRTGLQQAHPPGYQYVGNSNYGYWGGGGFWAFYGQYAFMSSMLGGHRIGRQDYGDYRRSGDGGRPYFGPNQNGRPAFGTRGSVTQKTKPQFYQRYRQRMSSSGRGFGTRGTTSTSRSGSRRFGK